ncbi:hypothetical protein BROUX41_003827 [Berkeleyomyces rouxiae]|uniref:uncharacterized protein n=1 Tax=Berkeleyomyces rouxiae TaxID=2035830 RepID=UPI003B7CB238
MLLDLLMQIPPSHWCQFICVTIGVAVIANTVAPDSLRDQLFCYGARQASPAVTAESQGKDKNTKEETSKGHLRPSLKILRLLLTYTGMLIPVPHSWFTHFYIMITAANVFWIYQYYSQGFIMRFIATKEVQLSTEPKFVPLERILAGMAMLSFQGVRRLLECLFVLKHSPNSYMLSMHWFLTFFFYTSVSVAVWIEGSSTMLNPVYTSSPAAIARIILITPIFLAFSYGQNHSHKHLASLKKYTLPTAGLFKYFVCPHYFCECMIYICFTVMTAPAGSMVNKTMLSALFFTAANLGVTSGSTRIWYQDKFGKDGVAKRWNMIPFVF